VTKTSSRHSLDAARWLSLFAEAVVFLLFLLLSGLAFTG